MYIIDNYYFVHAGINFNIEKPFSDEFSFFWMDKPIPDLLNKRKLIVGHNIKNKTKIISSVTEKMPIYFLDNGVYSNKEGYGNLVCINLDNDKLFFQRNID
jgi:serine/threonine protein phosphatase 1